MSDFRRRNLHLLQRRGGTYSIEDAFAGWILLGLVTGDEQEAARAVCGGSHDSKIDAVLLSDDPPVVWIVQGKLHKSENRVNEDKDDVDDFALLASRLVASEDEESEFWARLRNPEARSAFMGAREFMQRHRDLGLEPAVRLIYASTGKFTQGTRTSASRRVTNADVDGEIWLWGWDDVANRFVDYIHDIAGGIDEITLPIVENVVAPTPGTKATAWVFSVKGSDIAKTYEKHGDALFARNVRWYMGENRVNREIEETIEKHPERFWFFNNGLTLICDGVETKHDVDQGHRVELTRPQIVNGQQTTRTLHRLWALGDSDRAQVRRTMVSVRAIQPDSGTDSDDLVSGIVRATNWQTLVTASELHANDLLQIELGRELAAKGYWYKRKKGEADAPRGPRRVVSMEDLARAVGGSEHESLALREGITPLFTDYYDEIFDGSREPDDYLARWWIWELSKKVARGNKQRGWAKFLVLYDVWRDVGPEVRTRRRQFIVACEREDASVLTPLKGMLEQLYKVALRAYRSNRFEDGAELEVSPYFKRTESYSDYLDTWKKSKREQAAYEKNLSKFEDALPLVNV